MPRIARNKVLFTVDGQEYVAEFQHKHDDGEGIPFIGPVTGDELRLRHITTCLLRNGIIVRGESRCSVHDIYKWKRGIKESFVRALAKANIVPGTVQYGKFLKAFYMELPIKDYRKSDDNLTPPHNLNGTAYMGMD